MKSIEVLLDKCKRIIDALYEGKSMKAQLLEEGISTRSFYNQLEASEELMHLYCLGQQCKTEMLVDQIIDLADDPDIDPMRAKIRIDTRKWYASKMAPSKYGDRVDINVAHTVNINAALLEARGRASTAIIATEKIVERQLTGLLDDSTGYKPVEDETVDDIIDIFK